MKKTAVAIAAALALLACKKENTTVDNGVKDDSVAVVETQNPKGAGGTAVAALQEYSPSKTSELLKGKPDTLYVTNFFATWCGPCMKEIPHFKEKMESLKGQPVKFTFVSLDDRADWQGAVKDFATENQLENNIVLLDGNQLDPAWFAANFKTWKGEAIPFTYIRKGDKTEEYMGAMSKEQLDEKINAFK